LRQLDNAVRGMESRDRGQEVAGAGWVPIDDSEKDSDCTTAMKRRHEKVRWLRRNTSACLHDLSAVHYSVEADFNGRRTHTSRPRQGHTNHAPGLTAVGRAHRRHIRSRRSPPPLRPHRRIAITRRQSQLQPGPITRALHFLICGEVPLLTFDSRRYRLPLAERNQTWVGSGLDSKPKALVFISTFRSNALDLRSYRLFDNQRQACRGAGTDRGGTGNFLAIESERADPSCDESARKHWSG
jgi:hypothetical protein